MINNVQCITFDLDDTLWPIAPTILAAEEALYAWLEENYPRVCERYSLQDLRDKRDALSQSEHAIAHDVTALRFHSLQELAAEFDYTEELAIKGLRLFRRYRNQVIPFDESQPILALLADKFKLGAITNGNAQLEKIEIGYFFDFVVTVAEVGVSKPNPNIFHHAASIAGVPVNEIVHVGDCASTDVLGALHAGFKSVWLNSARKPWPGGQNPHAVIHSLSELPRVLNVKHNSRNR